MAGVRTSIHSLNGDRHLGAIRLGAYFVLNRANNALPYSFTDPALAIRDFACQSLDQHWGALPHAASPSRVLSDLFWLTLPWAGIHDELSGIRVLDAGCGSGSYGPRLLALANGLIESYAGTDVHPHEAWPALKKADRRLRFVVSDAESLRGAIPDGTNMFVSQSAIEHFDEDMTFFEQVRDYVDRTTGPVLQIHLVPSQACLYLYLRHGVRQYTPRTLSKVTRLFGPHAAPVLYRLGGRSCNSLHFSFITKPVSLSGRRDGRLVDPAGYERMLYEAIQDDMQEPQPSPAFYALVIQSRLARGAF